MKKILLYSAALTALLLGSCSKSDLCQPDGLEGGMGAVAFNLSTETRTGDYDPMDYYTIRIYSSEGLIRKYTPEDVMPEVLHLLAGSYSIDVELGDGSVATWTNKSYHGEADFMVSGGQQTKVDVLCKILNATVVVKYDDSVPQNLQAGFKTTATLYGEQLVYTENKTGYFLPDGEEVELEWSFAGTHAEKGAIAQSGKQLIKAGGKYTLNFKYSPDAVGGLVFDIEIVEPEEHDDVILFSPEPVFKGDGFDLGTAQKFYNTTKTILLSSPNTLSQLTVEVGSQTIDLTNTSYVVKTDDKNWKITLTDEFFSPYPGGENAYRFIATDNEGGSGKATATFITQGIVPVTAAECNLWLNTADVKVKIFDSSVSSVEVKMRRAGGEWATYTATKLDDETYVAKVEPKWTTMTNSKGLEVYKPDTNTGIFANTTYEAKAVIAGVEKEAVASFATTVSQPIPYADFEDSTLSCYTTSNKNTIFWGSGNNSFKKNLCSQSTFPGMGGQHCALLASSSTLGVLASGNLFTGNFNMSGMAGTVSFGQDYNWVARPSALRVKLHATIGKANIALYKDDTGNLPLKEGDQDMARIYALIVDWSARPGVTSGTAAPTGCFDPSATKSLAGAGNIIACASLLIDSSTSGDSMVTVEIPFEFYDKVTKPTSAYKLVISAANSAYGDYMCGCDANVMYLDDFEWVY